MRLFDLNTSKIETIGGWLLAFAILSAITLIITYLSTVAYEGSHVFMYGSRLLLFPFLAFAGFLLYRDAFYEGVAKAKNNFGKFIELGNNTEFRLRTSRVYRAYKVEISGFDFGALETYLIEDCVSYDQWLVKTRFKLPDGEFAVGYDNEKSKYTILTRQNNQQTLVTDTEDDVEQEEVAVPKERSKVTILADN